MKTTYKILCATLIASSYLSAQDKWDTDGNNGVGSNAKNDPNKTKKFFTI